MLREYYYVCFWYFPYHIGNYWTNVIRKTNLLVCEEYYWKIKFSMKLYIYNKLMVYITSHKFIQIYLYTKNIHIPNKWEWKKSMKKLQKCVEYPKVNFLRTLSKYNIKKMFFIFLKLKIKKNGLYIGWSDHFFRILGWACKFSRVAPIRIVGSSSFLRY
jgi:hypothetical protein